MSPDIKDPKAHKLAQATSQTTGDKSGIPVSGERPLNPATVLAELRQIGLETPSEATGIVRADRDRC